MTLFRTLQSQITKSRRENSDIDSLIKESGYRNTSLKGIANILDLLRNKGYSTKVYMPITVTKTVKSTTRMYAGMSYKQLQAANKKAYGQLSKKAKSYLREHGYKNTGWDHIIHSYELLQNPELKSMVDYETTKKKLQAAVEDSRELIASLHVCLDDSALDDYGPLVLKKSK